MRTDPDESINGDADGHINGGAKVWLHSVMAQGFGQVRGDREKEDHVANQNCGEVFKQAPSGDREEFLRHEIGDARKQRRAAWILRLRRIIFKVALDTAGARYSYRSAISGSTRVARRAGK